MFNEAFVTKLDKELALRYSTYLGGNKQDRANDVGTDADGKVYVVGTTYSPNFAQGKFNQERTDACPGPCPDAFLAKLDTSAADGPRSLVVLDLPRELIA